MTSPRLSSRSWQSWDLNLSSQAQRCLVKLVLLLPMLLYELHRDGAFTRMDLAFWPGHSLCVGSGAGSHRLPLCEIWAELEAYSGVLQP